MPEVRWIATFLSVVTLLVLVSSPTTAQRAGRRVATLDLLAEHPIFFHGEEIVVQAESVGESVLTYLVDGNTRLLVLDVPPPPPGVRETIEVIGTFYDIGRLQTSDPRAVGQPFERLARSLLDKAWPGVGELPVIVADSSRLVTDRPAPSLRSVALNPLAHLDQGVTVTGRFRGRNLYGDLPDSPGESRYDFVLTSADAAVWIVGKEPKGDDFELDVQARIDTGRWLEVTGSVRVHEGMVIIDAGTIRLAEPTEESAAPRATTQVRQGPPPEVIFSTPLEGDTDVPSDSMVRIQFSRDMAPASFDGRVHVSYAGVSPTAPADPTTPVIFATEYRALNRVLEVRFEQSLEAFRPVTVQLLDGVTSSDGVSLAPWSLSFFSGQ